MKPGKQSIFFPLLNTDPANQAVSGNHRAVLSRMAKLLAGYSLFHRLLKAWAANYLDGQIMATHEMGQAKTQWRSCNFMATPQSLFLLPGHSEKIAAYSKKQAVGE
jgi:hypothetical protein